MDTLVVENRRIIKRSTGKVTDKDRERKTPTGKGTREGMKRGRTDVKPKGRVTVLRQCHSSPVR